MFQVPIEQYITYEEGRRITSFEDIRRTMERNQYQHYWTITKVKWKDAIVIIVDQFTKMIRLKATTMNVSSEEIAKIYWDEI